MFMKRLIIFPTLLLSICSVNADSITTDKDGFITREHALHCMQMNQQVINSQQHMLTFETNKATLKSKIDYLHDQIEIRRQKIEQLDQKHYQHNNENYNQLIDQFEELVNERKQTIAQYNQENQQHLTHHTGDINLQNSYTEQCLNNIKITKPLHKDICLMSTSLWCSRLSF
jgi:predicted nuclease with TOPRIM domain